jgi:SAND domain
LSQLAPAYPLEFAVLQQACAGKTTPCPASWTLVAAEGDSASSAITCSANPVESWLQQAQHMMPPQIHGQGDGVAALLPETPAAVPAAVALGGSASSGNSGGGGSGQLYSLSSGAVNCTAGGGDAPAPAPPSSTAAAGGRIVLPDVQLQVVCGDVTGVLHVARAKIVMHTGTPDQREVSPTEFERLGGKSSTKKWKQSILIVEDGAPIDVYDHESVLAVTLLCKQCIVFFHGTCHALEVYW